MDYTIAEIDSVWVEPKRVILAFIARIFDLLAEAPKTDKDLLRMVWSSDAIAPTLNNQEGRFYLVEIKDW